MKEENPIEQKLKEVWNIPHPAVEEKQVRESWSQLLPKLQRTSEPRKKFPVMGLISFAATLLLVVAGYFYLETNPTLTTINRTAGDQQITLSDGSLVILKSGAELTYKKYFYSNRTVHLKGEAFFKVAKDSLREFTVNSGSSTLKVLGTSFLVNARSNTDTEISLYTGRVSVAIKGIASSWGLIPGERLVYKDGQAHIENFNTQMSFETGNSYIDIEGQKMEEFVPFLKERYGYSFSREAYDPKVRVTLRINKADSLEQVLELLSIINNDTYEINEETREIISVR